MSSNISRATPSDPEFARATARHEELERDLDGPSGTPNALMREHLEALRFYLLGGMAREYGLTLNLARQLLPSVEDAGLRRRLTDLLGSQPVTGSNPA